MKAEEIEQAAKEYKLQRPNTKISIADFMAGAEMVNERQPYSKEDIKIAIKQGFTAAIMFFNDCYLDHQISKDGIDILFDQYVNKLEESK